MSEKKNIYIFKINDRIWFDVSKVKYIKFLINAY